MRQPMIDLAALAPFTFENARVQDDAIRAATPHGELTIAFHRPGIVRLTIAGPAAHLGQVVLPSAQGLAVKATQAGDVLTIAHDGVAVSLETADGTLSLEFDGRTLLGPPRDAHFRRKRRVPPFARSTRGFLFAIDLGEGEPVYGHGEKWSRLDHRGQLITSWNEDALGVNAEISYKNSPFAWSPAGWGLLVGNAGRSIHAIGFAPLSHRAYAIQADGDGLDLFLMAGRDPAAIMGLFRDLTGPAPTVPRWSLGTWLSKAYYADAEEFTRAASQCRDHRLPMDVITLDGRAWLDTGTRFSFEWDARRYPDPAAILEPVRASGFKVCCWEYPLVAIANPGYRDLAARGFFLKDRRTGEPWRFDWDPAPFGSVLTPLPPSAIVDFTNPEAYAWWRDQHERLFDVGVDVMKSDFGEQVPDDPDCVAFDGTTGPALHNIYALLYNRCVYEASARRFGEGLVFARAGWTGSHRYPVQWGGDPQADWGGLAGSIRGMLSWAASGNPWYATDIGGFYGDQRDAELFVRWCQAAVFASHMRFHGIGAREPWSFGAEALGLVREAIGLRYALIPYIEMALEACRATGMPLCRPMAMAYPQAREGHVFDTQYMFGEDLLVAPILLPGGRVSVWLPDGRWQDWFSEEIHEGNRRLDLELPLERFPVFLREGARIGLAGSVLHTGEWGQGSIPIAEMRRFP